MKILLPVDGSKFSEEAARKVAAEFRTGIQVRVLHVIDPVSGVFPTYLSADLIPHRIEDPPEVEAERRKQSQQLVERIAGKLRKAGFRTSTAVELGDPRTTIVDDAAKWKADLIVMGSHGLKGLSRLVMGSVSEAVARHAACSVQIVRLPAGKTRP